MKLNNLRDPSQHCQLASPFTWKITMYCITITYFQELLALNGKYFTSELVQCIHSDYRSDSYTDYSLTLHYDAAGEKIAQFYCFFHVSQNILMVTTEV